MLLAKRLAFRQRKRPQEARPEAALALRKQGQCSRSGLRLGGNGFQNEGI